MSVIDISLQKLEELNKKGAILIDVRSKQEYDEYHIDGAISIPIYELQKKIRKIAINKDQIICIYCESGMKSKSARKCA